MSRLVALKSVATLSDLAALLGFKAPALAYILYKIPAANRYTTFAIPKRGGSTRTIAAPIPQLKLVQRNLATLLHDCWDEHCLKSGASDELAHGFKRRRSIFSNARKHRNRNYVFNVDIADFFPSLNFGRVRGYFLKDATFSLSPAIATYLAQIACHDNALPQGSPCSPVIANLIGHVLDIHLVAMAAKHGCTYSRYADDLTFSTNHATFPLSIANRDPTDPHKWEPGNRLTQIVTRNGFALNPTKTRMQYHDSRQEVSGLIVNRKVNVRREYRHNIRAMVHNLQRKGSFEIHDSSGGTTAGSVSQLQGMLTFIDSIDLRNKYLKTKLETRRDAGGKALPPITVIEFGKTTSKEVGPLTPSERLFQNFLIYKEFFATPMPVIVCEGDTDNVYLLHAIHSLHKAFPELIGPPAGGASRLKVRIFRYVNTRVGRLLGLGDGGGSVLKTMIETYMRETSRFLAPHSKHPFIILVDNDTGSDSIKGILSKYGLAFPIAGGFIHVRSNLYVMRTPPLLGKTDTEIEDFFDAAAKAITVDGKTFHADKGFDKTIHFGKTIFAHRVVRPNAATINFGGFTPILQTIVDIQKHCASTPVAAPTTPTP
jgi:RNA-directed DNA polymerase